MPSGLLSDSSASNSQLDSFEAPPPHTLEIDPSQQKYYQQFRKIYHTAFKLNQQIIKQTHTHCKLLERISSLEVEKSQDRTKSHNSGGRKHRIINRRTSRENMMRTALGEKSIGGTGELPKKSREGSTAQFNIAIAAMVPKAHCSSTQSLSIPSRCAVSSANPKNDIPFCSIKTIQQSAALLILLLLHIHPLPQRETLRLLRKRFIYYDLCQLLKAHLHVYPLFHRCFHIENIIHFCPSCCLSLINIGCKINLISDEHERSIRALRPRHIVPLVNGTMESRSFIDIEDHDDSLATVEVTRYDSSILFLPSCIPNVKFYYLASDAHLFYLEIYGRDIDTPQQEILFDIPSEESCLPHRRVANHYYLEFRFIPRTKIPLFQHNNQVTLIIKHSTIHHIQQQTQPQTIINPTIALIYIFDYKIIQINMSQIINLPYVLPDMKKAKGFISGIRPYRQGGVRMEKSLEGNGKTVYHNYGHGGAGISIAYGCVQHVFNTIFLPDKVDKTQEIAVIGVGIIGLTTAYFLVKNGYKVNVYAQLTPFNHQKGKPQITTTVAAGYWMPLKVGNKAQTAAFATSTWKHYQEVISLQQKTNKNLGISTIPAYVINDEGEMYHFRIEGVIEPKDCMVTFGDNNYYKAKKFTTLVIETHLYCSFLKEELQKSGKFKLQSKIFKSLADVQGLKENIIFNSMGLGSKQIFGDNNMRGIKGHIIKFDLKDFLPIKDFLLAMKTPQGGLLLQVPQRQSGKFMLGVTFQQGKTNPFPEMMGIQKAFDQSHNFYLQIDSHQLKPKL